MLSLIASMFFAPLFVMIMAYGGAFADELIDVAARGDTNKSPPRESRASSSAAGRAASTTARAMEHNERGRQLLRKGNAAHALTEFETAIALDASLSLPHLHRGLALQRLGKHQAAIEPLEAALALSPNAPLARIELARSLIELNRLQDAEQRLAEGTAVTPVDVRIAGLALVIRAGLYERTHRIELALGDLRRGAATCAQHCWDIAALATERLRRLTREESPRSQMPHKREVKPPTAPPTGRPVSSEVIQVPVWLGAAIFFIASMFTAWLLAQVARAWRELSESVRRWILEESGAVLTKAIFRCFCRFILRSTSGAAAAALLVLAAQQVLQIGDVTEQAMAEATSFAALYEGQPD